MQTESSGFYREKAVPVSLMALMVSFAYASLFFVVFAISMMSLRLITGKIFDRKGANYVVYPALALFALGLLVLSQIDSVPGFMLAAVLIGMGFGSAQPCLQTISIQRSAKHRIGHATSIYFTCYDIGIALGSLILGIVIAHFDYSIAYMLCAVIIILSLFFYKLVVDKPAVTD